MKIRATLPGPKVKDAEGNEKRSVKAAYEADYDFGDNLKALVANHGEDKVYKAAVGSWVIAIQNGIRLILETATEENKDQKAIKKEVDTFLEEWSPSEKKRGKTAAEKLRDQLGSMTEEERKALFKDFASGKRAA